MPAPLAKGKYELLCPLTRLSVVYPPLAILSCCLFSLLFDELPTCLQAHAVYRPTLSLESHRASLTTPLPQAS